MIFVTTKLISYVFFSWFFQIPNSYKVFLEPWTHLAPKACQISSFRLFFILIPNFGA